MAKGMATPKAPNPLKQKNPAMGAGGAHGGMLGQLQNRMMRQFSPQHLAVTAMMRNMKPQQPKQATQVPGLPTGGGLQPMQAPQAMPGSQGAAPLPGAPGGNPVAALHQMVGAAVMQHIAKHMGGTPGMPGPTMGAGVPAGGPPGSPNAAPARVPMRGGVMGMKHGAGTIGAMGRLYKPMVGGKPKAGGVSVGSGQPNS